MSYGTRYSLTTGGLHPTMSGAAILAIVCAIASFFVGAGWGFLLAVVAIIAGVIGLIVSISPRVRGGVTSFFAILAGLIGIVAAIIKLAFDVAT